MLLIFTGKDMVATRARAHEVFDEYAENGADTERLEAADINRSILQDHAGAQSLFSGGALSATLLDTPSESATAFSDVVESAPLLAESPNIFIVLDGALPAAEKKTLKKHASSFEEVKGAPAGERFNPFTIADALARKDKKALWVLYTRAQKAGLSGEEIIGTLFWQVKCMRLAHLCASAEAAGLKPFVYQKSKRGAQKFSSEELTALSAGLIDVYHQAHLGQTDIDLALEQWVLGV